MQNLPLKIVSVFEDNVIYAEQNNTMETIEFADIKTMDFARIISDNIIQVNLHDNSVVILDNGNPKDHQLGQTYQAWLDTKAWIASNGRAHNV